MELNLKTKWFNFWNASQAFHGLMKIVKMATEYYEYNTDFSHLQSCCYGNYGASTSHGNYMNALPDIPEGAPVAYYGNFTACWWSG